MSLIQTQRTIINEHYLRVFRARLPAVLHPDTWTRYGYSIEDIQSTLSIFKPSTCYVCMQLLIPASSTAKNTSVKSLPHCSKRTIIAKIIEYLVEKGDIPLTRPSVLISEEFFFTPRLPVVILSSSEFRKCRTLCKEISFTTLNKRNILFTHGGCIYTPIANVLYELYAVRVVPCQDFINDMVYHQPCRANYSFEVESNGVYFNGSDEAVIFKQRALVV